MVYFYKQIPINYNSWGDGPAVVLLHGFLESSTMWQPVIAQLSKKNKVIAIDLPGHGKSGTISEEHSMELMAEVVNEILLHLNISSATLIGHSMGGYVALALTERFSEKVNKLILLNSSPFPDSKQRQENRNRALKVIEQNNKAFISMAIGNLIINSARDKFKNEIESLKAEAYTFPIKGITAAVKGMRDRKDRSSVLKNYPNKKYVILSKGDAILPFKTTKNILENDGVTVKTIEGGHMSLIENSNKVLELLNKLI
ncbi:MAG: alpha/beta hydrolase [Aequorivita sp.]|nr:alpha/beta hydrolase [Aequorivita sp.]|tara:strand:- start:58753 stop:59523 length:771 start_codon:yes stop_codon:yes gene_type:complete